MEGQPPTNSERFFVQHPLIAVFGAMFPYSLLTNSTGNSSLLWSQPKLATILPDSWNAEYLLHKPGCGRPWMAVCAGGVYCNGTRATSSSGTTGWRSRGVLFSFLPPTGLSTSSPTEGRCCLSITECDMHRAPLCTYVCYKEHTSLHAKRIYNWGRGQAQHAHKGVLSAQE